MLTQYYFIVNNLGNALKQRKPDNELSDFLPVILRIFAPKTYK
jgi:hypothetical protein